ncbi:MAG: hypothetical protein JST05_01955 [Acidobacteria bacterium]|nr:hypothetical protein [Acidobacteriota bacterium]
MEGIRRDTRVVVEQLEAQVARLRAAVWILFLALLAAGGAFLWRRAHAKASPSAAPKEIVLEDGQGGKLQLTGQGLVVTDAQGQTRVALILDGSSGAHLSLKDATGAAALQATPGALAMTDAKKDSALVTTANGATIQLRRADKVVFKQPWDAPEVK